MTPLPQRVCTLRVGRRECRDHLKVNRVELYIRTCFGDCINIFAVEPNLHISQMASLAC